MANGVKVYYRTEMGLEVTPGTAVVSTTRLRAPFVSIVDKTKIETVAEDIGIIGGADRTNKLSIDGDINVPSHNMTFEQFQYWLYLLTAGPKTGLADGTGSDFIYTTLFPTTAAANPTTATFVTGDNFETRTLNYGLCTKIEVTFVHGTAIKVTATVIGQQVTYQNTGFLVADTVPVPVVSEAVSNFSKIYLDAIGGTYGATQIVGQINGGKITLESMWSGYPSNDGVLWSTNFQQTGWKVGGSISFLHNTAVSGSRGGAIQQFLSETPMLLRMGAYGKTLATAGTVYSQKQVLLDLPIKYLSGGDVKDQNGFSLATMVFESKYNATAGNAGKCTVVNELAALI